MVKNAWPLAYLAPELSGHGLAVGVPADEGRGFEEQVEAEQLAQARHHRTLDHAHPRRAHGHGAGEIAGGPRLATG